MKKIRYPSDSLKSSHQILKSWSQTKKIVVASIFAIFAGIFQSAGGYLPGIGFMISPFATMPILFISIISFNHGVSSYMISIFLIAILEPSELFIFPFSTGLLGLTLGLGIRIFRKPIGLVLFSGFSLFIGICIPLYFIGYPIMGPIISSIPGIKNILIILVFTTLYSWLWLKVGLYLLERLDKILRSIG